jgi:hypothetical protein
MALPMADQTSTQEAVLLEVIINNINGQQRFKDLRKGENTTLIQNHHFTIFFLFKLFAPGMLSNHVW